MQSFLSGQNVLNMICSCGVWCVVCGNLKKTLIRMSEVSVWLDHSGPLQRRCDSHRRCLRSHWLNSSVPTKKIVH